MPGRGCSPKPRNSSLDHQMLDVDIRPGSAVRQQQVLASRSGAALERSSSGGKRVASLSPSQMMSSGVCGGNEAPGSRSRSSGTSGFSSLEGLICTRSSGLTDCPRPAGAETCQRRQDRDQDRDQEQGRSLPNMVCLLLLKPFHTWLQRLESHRVLPINPDLSISPAPPLIRLSWAFIDHHK